MKTTSEADTNPVTWRFFVETYSAESHEDDYLNGEDSGPAASYWTDKDCPTKLNNYPSVEAALEAICKANYFDYDKSNWVVDPETSEFHSDFTVDEANEEVTPESDAEKIEEWKEGKRKLWNCHITAKVMKRTAAVPVSSDDYAGFETI